MSNYIWAVSAGGIITSGGTNTDHFVNVLWLSTGAQVITVNYTTPAGCTAVEPGMQNINVLPSPTPVISGQSVVTQGQTVTYSTPYIADHLYSWSVSNGNAVICFPERNCITVTWVFPCGIINPGFVTLTETIPETGCSKTVTLLITIN